MPHRLFPHRAFTAVVVLLASTLTFALTAQIPIPLVDTTMVARIRDEGLQRSRVMDIASYITDVLGARLTLSDDMQRAQTWVAGHMREIGLENVAIEPFMDYGTRWDNEYVSLHLMSPDYQPMVGYPLSHTPGTDGKQIARVVNAEIRTRADLEKLRGTLRGAAVLSTPPAVVDRARFSTGVARYTDAEPQGLEQLAPPAPPAPAPAAGHRPDVVRPEEKIAFYKAEGVVAVLQSESGWPGAVRGFARPGTRTDNWGREGTLAAPPIVAITPAYEKLSAYFNQDYGPGQYRGIYLQGNEAARPMMTAWTAPFHDLGMTTVSPRGVGSTDHISFDRVGLPGFQFIQDRVGGTGGHTNLDFLETLPPDDLIRNAVIMASFAYHAAITDTRVPRKTP